MHGLSLLEVAAIACKGLSSGMVQKVGMGSWLLVWLAKLVEKREFEGCLR